MSDRPLSADERAPEDYDDIFDEGDDDDDEWDGEGLDGDDDLSNCHGYFPDQGTKARFQCGAVGSEDCDECPMSRWLGLTNSEIDELEHGDE